MRVIPLSPRIGESSRRRFILVSGRLSATNVSLLAAARAHFREAALIPGDELTDRVRPGDTVLARLEVRPSLDGIERGLLELQELEHAHSPARILNPAGALFVCHDKLATAITLGAAGVPHPRTACVADPSELSRLAPPVIVKPRLGRNGEDVFLCESWLQLRRRFRSIASRAWYQRHGAIVQALIRPGGPELRVTVAAGAAISAHVPHDAAELAVRAAQAARADLVHVDLIPTTTGGWIVLDLNAASDLSSDGGAGLEGVSARIVDQLVDREKPSRLPEDRFARDRRVATSREREGALPPHPSLRLSRLPESSLRWRTSGYP